MYQKIVKNCSLETVEASDEEENYSIILQIFCWALSSKKGQFFSFFTFENGYFPNEILKNITLCRTFLYRLESYVAAAASANVYINTMRHFNQKRSHSIQKTMLEWTLCC